MGNEHASLPSTWLTGIVITACSVLVFKAWRTVQGLLQGSPVFSRWTVFPFSNLVHCYPVTLFFHCLKLSSQGFLIHRFGCDAGLKQGTNKRKWSVHNCSERALHSAPVLAQGQLPSSPLPSKGLLLEGYWRKMVWHKNAREGDGKGI